MQRGFYILNKNMKYEKMKKKSKKTETKTCTYIYKILGVRTGCKTSYQCTCILDMHRLGWDRMVTWAQTTAQKTSYRQEYGECIDLD